MAIVFPHPKPHPIPIDRRRRNDYYRAYSPKLNRLVEFESGLEYHHWVLRESDPSIVSLCEQFPRVTGVASGKQFTYTFDLYWRDSQGQETCVEVKPRNKLVLDSQGKYVPKNWDLAVDAAHQWGVQCKYITEEGIEPHQTRIHNWITILPFVQRAIHEDLSHLEQHILDCVDHHMTQSFESLTRKIKHAHAEQVVAAACHLLHQGRLIAEELDREPFHPHSLVQVPNNGTEPH